MSEQESTSTEEKPGEQATGSETETVDHAAEAAKWKALSRKNEERAKENEAAAKRLAEIEDANKSELEKSAARAEAAEKKLAEREAADERAKLVAEIAEAKNVKASVLRGDTREELEAHADEILTLIPQRPKAPAAGVLGKVGDDVSSDDKKPTPNELIRAAFQKN